MTRDLSYLTVPELRAVCKYFKMEHSTRARRADLEALVCLAELSYGLGLIETYKLIEPTVDIGANSLDLFNDCSTTGSLEGS